MKIHFIKVVPGSDDEIKFTNLLVKIGAIPELVMCRTDKVFNTGYNEYIISEALYRQIKEGLNLNG